MTDLPPDSSERRVCPECKNEILEGAIRCGHCGILVKNWQRLAIRILGALGALSAISVAVSLWSIARDLTDTNVNFEATAQCLNDRIIVAVQNFEKSNAIRVYLPQELTIHSDELGASVPVQLDKQATFPVSVNYPWSGKVFESGSSTENIFEELCDGGCKVEMVVTAATFDEKLKTPQNVICRVQPNPLSAILP